MPEDDETPIFVRKPRQPYSGMVLDSIFRLLQKVVAIVVAIGISIMLLTISR